MIKQMVVVAYDIVNNKKKKHGRNYGEIWSTL